MRRTLALLLFMSAVVAAAVLLWASLAPSTQAQQPAALPDSLRDQRMAQRGDAPIQPIFFSHKIHAGDNKIPCLYCHVGADDSPVARVPAVETCMGCHKLVGTTLPGVAQLTQFWDRKQAILWTKVNDVPDHVRFTHKRHIDAGISCQTCHGEIQTQDRVKLGHTLNMGFCVDCHKSRLNDPVHAASLDCATCHK